MLNLWLQFMTDQGLIHFGSVNESYNCRGNQDMEVNIVFVAFAKSKPAVSPNAAVKDRLPILVMSAAGKQPFSVESGSYTAGGGEVTGGEFFTPGFLKSCREPDINLDGCLEAKLAWVLLEIPRKKDYPGIN